MLTADVSEVADRSTLQREKMKNTPTIDICPSPYCKFTDCTKLRQYQRGRFCISHHNFIKGKQAGKRKTYAMPDAALSSLPFVSSSSSNSSASSVAQKKCDDGGGYTKKASGNQTNFRIDSTDTSVVSRATSTGKSNRLDVKWTCPKCRGDVREPPLKHDAPDHELLKHNAPIVTCALKGCSAPRYHLQCTGIPSGCEVYSNAVISSTVGELPDSFIGVNNNNKMPWWRQVSDNASCFSNKYKPLQRDWPLQRESFICPACDVEGSSRYLMEYFEKFHAMKKNFYADYLGGSKKFNSGEKRGERADESVESRTGEIFLWHLLTDNCGDRVITNWNASEIQLLCISRVLTYLSKELQQQRKEDHNIRREKRQKNELKVDPSYFVGMPIRLFNPIENSYHSGRIIDCKLNAPYKIDPPLSETKPSAFDASFPEPDMNKLVDENIVRTKFLVRFRHGCEGRKISVHQWIYLEEHAVVVGGEICWAKVENEYDVKDNDCSDVKSARSMDRTAEERHFRSPYRPVQISFRSLLEMCPVDELDSVVIAMGFGRDVTHIRMTLDHNMNEMGQPSCFPFTFSNPPWLDQILSRARLSDEDVVLGVAMACMEKEEERRVRSWSNVSISHIEMCGQSRTKTHS